MDEPLHDGAKQRLDIDRIGPFGPVEKEERNEEDLDKANHVPGCCWL
jgi:hypothetical protein